VTLSLPIITEPAAAPACGPATPAVSRRLPPWLRQNLGPGGGHAETAHLIAELGLEGKTEDLEQDEPARVAEAARRLGLAHVVVTSVTRDDLPDGGAEHFRRTVVAVREATGAAIEVLVPDFIGKPGALERLMESRPDVFNHNTETVPRLYRRVRGRKSVYAWTLQLLAEAKRIMPEVKTKTGLMLGLGETRDELLDVFADLLDRGVDFLTLGQYLQPAADALPVDRYVHPDEFVELGDLARRMGFRKVASGPLVRSSYHARDMAEDAADVGRP